MSVHFVRGVFEIWLLPIITYTCGFEAQSLWRNGTADNKRLVAPAVNHDDIDIYSIFGSLSPGFHRSFPSQERVVYPEWDLLTRHATG